jgi:hypothetical protein
MINTLGKKIALSLLAVILTGALAHPAFAHNFVQNSNSDLIAKIQEFKTESNLVAENISNSTLAQWHVSKSQEYFGSNEIIGLSQSNSTLASNVSTAIDDLYSQSGQPNADPTVAAQKASALNQMLDQAESAEISVSDQNNATIQSLAIIGVLNEALKDYGDAIGSNVDLTNMSNMNMGSMSGMQSGNNMPGMSGMSSTPIVNVAAYQSAQALTDTAQTMFNNLKSIAPSSSSPYLDKIGNALMDLKQAVNSKESGNSVMMIVHMQIHPNFISGFNLQVVPEFPMPILLVVISFIGIVVMSRVFPRVR